MTFQDWLNKVDEGDEVSVFDCLMAGEYAKTRNTLGILEEAFEAGLKEGIDRTDRGTD